MSALTPDNLNNELESSCSDSEVSEGTIRPAAFANDYDNASGYDDASDYNDASADCIEYPVGADCGDITKGP
jgi:hypothetical protein